MKFADAAGGREGTPSAAQHVYQSHKHAELENCSRAKMAMRLYLRRAQTTFSYQMSKMQLSDESVARQLGALKRPQSSKHSTKRDPTCPSMIKKFLLRAHKYQCSKIETNM